MEAEEQIGEMEDRVVEITATENNFKKRMKKTEEKSWDNIISINIHIIGVPEEEDREKGPEKIFEDIITKNFPNIG